MTSQETHRRDLLRRSPDPEGAAPFFERWADGGGPWPTDPEGEELLIALGSQGSFLQDILLGDPTQFAALTVDPFLHQPKPSSVAIAEVAAATAFASDFVDFQRLLRVHARREFLRLGAREIGWGTTLDVARELAGFADGCLQAALSFCTRAQTDTPRTSGGADPGFVVLGMGKLGGEELNFSSDIDLIYLYGTDDGAAGSRSLHEHYAHLCQQVTQAIGESTAHGMVFRVDLRLRPEGRSGPICNALGAAEGYYESFGRTWERVALLRARPCAGDVDLGRRTLQTLRPFVFPRSLGPETIEELRALRRLYQAEGEKGDGFDVKLGRGGIRDVELVAQVLQLMHAGRRPELRERTTLPTLRKLGLAGLLSDHETRILSDSYRFLRRVEHRLQLEQGTQTQRLPTDPQRLQRLGRRLGFAGGEEFLAELTRVRALVSTVSDTLGEPESAPPAPILRLLDPVSTREQLVTELSALGFRDLDGSADALESVLAHIPSAWLTEIVRSPDPDRALTQFRELVLRGSRGLFELLAREPRLVRMLAGLFGTSLRLTRHLLVHPDLWEPLLDSVGETHPTELTWVTALPERLRGLDEEPALREMRRYQTEQILRIGVHDVADILTPDEVSQQLGRLAQACLAAAVAQVADRLGARYGMPTATLTILALGSFGAHELRYGSDLDLVFLYSREGTTSGGMEHQEWFARLAQRLIGALGALLDEGRLYDVDTRLRPSGSQGLLVTTYGGFDRYHLEDAAPWERVALLRARPVFTSTWPTSEPEATGPAFARLLDTITYDRPLDQEVLRAELLRMRTLIEDQRADNKSVHLRFSPGGLTDLEFLAAFLQLTHPADPTVHTSSPYLALAALTNNGVLSGGEALLDHYRFLQRASLRVRLLRDRPDDRVLPEDIEALGRSLGVDQLEANLRFRFQQIRAAFTQFLDIPHP